MKNSEHDDFELARLREQQRAHETDIDHVLDHVIERAKSRWHDGWKLHQRLWVRRAAAIATVLLAMGSVVCWRHLGDRDTHKIVTQPPSIPASSTLVHDDGTLSQRSGEPKPNITALPRDVTSDTVSRPKGTARPRSRREANPRRQAIEDDRLQAALRTLIEVPETDDACVAYTLERTQRIVDERRLMAIVVAGPSSAKIAAVRLLGWVGSESSVPMLLLHRHDPAVGAEAKIALNRRVSSEQLAAVAVSPGLPAVRRAALEQLISRSDDQSLVMVYQWVAQRATRDSVLEVVRTQADLPIDAWWKSIEQGAPLERYVAGYLLAQVNRTDLVRLLIERSKQLPLNEAVVYCLMNHPSPLAKNFIQAANREAATAHFMNQVRLNAQLALR